MAKPNWVELYTRHHHELGDSGVEAMLDAAAERWDLAPTLTDNGVLVFPHAAVFDCGIQTAAVVNAVFDSHAEKVLVIGVLHGWTTEMQQARDQVAQGADLTGHPLRGIHGPDLPNSRDEWRLDHSLISWRHFWQVESRRRTQAPIMRQCFPFLAGTNPTTLPNYQELSVWAEDAVIVATADMFHHGIGYGDPPSAAFAPEDGGLELARKSITQSNELLGKQAYSAYLRHCLKARNDARSAGPLFRALCPVNHAEIVDLRASDMVPIYDAPPPSWVAAALVSWQGN